MLNFKALEFGRYMLMVNALYLDVNGSRTWDVDVCGYD